jgi:hypothetical protein
MVTTAMAVLLFSARERAGCGLDLAGPEGTAGLVPGAHPP